MMLGDFLLGPNDENQGIYTGDARRLAQALPDESVDLIFTDPVYDQIEDYRWLAETAVRVLKPDSACLVWTATPLLSKIIKAMEPPLLYAWQLIQRKFGPCYPGRMGITVYTICLWFDKGRTKRKKAVSDFVQVVNAKDITGYNSGHAWAKHEIPIYKWMEPLSGIGEIVFDPFTGGGTVRAVCKMLGRRWLAFEIEPETAELARERVRTMQPPLFVLEHEQLKMEGMSK